MLEPLGSSFDHSQSLDGHRRSGSNAAERLSRFSSMVAELLEMREDDRAHSMLGGVFDQVAILKRDFTEIGRLRREEAATRARQHFQTVGSKDHQDREEHRTERLQQDAEADAVSPR